MSDGIIGEKPEFKPKEESPLEELNPITFLKGKWQYRNIKRENRRDDRFRNNELELKHIQTIDSPEKLARLAKEAEYMQSKWGKILNNDPCYNPNLTRNRDDYSINI